MNEDMCCIVVHSNYADGTDAYAFWKEDDAKKSVSEDAKMTMASLLEQGYINATLLKRPDEIEVYVPDTDIYYSWSIGLSVIR